MTLADILDGAFKLLRVNWKQIGLAVLVYSAPVAFITLVMIALFSGDGSDIDGATGVFSTFDLGVGVGAAFSLLGLQVLYYILAFPLLSATIARIGSASYLGRTLSAADAFNGVARLWPTLVGAGILSGILMTVSFFACLVPFFVIWPLLSLTVPVIAVEEQSAIPALQRSWKLFASRFWSYLGTTLLAALVGMFVGVFLELPASLLGSVFEAIGLTPVAWLFGSIAAVMRNLVVLPFLGIVSLLIYFDARIRKEGFDVQMMSARLDDGPARG